MTRYRHPPRHEESEIGRALMKWVEVRERTLPALEWLYHIPNGGARSALQGKLLKAEGLRPGVWDYHLACQDLNSRHIGLWIELKKPAQRSHKNGGLSDDQVRFGVAHTHHGHLMRVCYCWTEAAAELESYLLGRPLIGRPKGTPLEDALKQGRGRG